MNENEGGVICFINQPFRKKRESNIVGHVSNLQFRMEMEWRVAPCLA